LQKKSFYLNDDIRVNRTDGSFMATPIPLGGQYILQVSRDKNAAFSDIVTVDESHPIQKVDIRLVDGVNIEVLVLGPDGNPASGIPVSFSMNWPDGGSSYSPESITDQHGHVRFSVNPDPRIEYS